MSKVKLGGSALLSPAPPAMVTCRSAESKDNIITVAWTGIVCSHPPKTYISVRPERFSYGIIKETGVFAINLTPASLVRAADLCGMKTGRKVDKFSACGLEKFEPDDFPVPLIAESPLALCCRVSEVVPLGSHDMFIADVESVYADESLFDKNGKLCLYRTPLAAYSHGEYFALGEKIGDFGFSVRKKSRHK